MKFNKIIVSETLELSKDLGLVVEVVEGKEDDVLTLWLQYKNKEGEWAYKSSKGATGIRIPMKNNLQKFLSDNLVSAFKASKEHIKEVKKDVASKIDDMTEEEKAILLKALLAKETKEEPKKSTKKSTKKEDTLDLTLENVLKALKK